MPPKQLETELGQLISDLPTPIVLMGDFNSHSSLWGSYKNDVKGAIIEKLTAEYNLTIINSGEHTRLDPRNGSTSAIDLTIASPEIVSKLQWHVETDNRTSDHFPVIINSPITEPKMRRRRQWMYEQADWPEFENILLERIQRNQTYSVEELSEHITYAAEHSIPRTLGKIGNKAVPWWNSEVKKAVRMRRKKLRALRRINDDDPYKTQALKEFQMARNVSRKTVKEAKKTSWDNFVSSLNPQTSSTEMWQKVNALRGRRMFKKPVLVVDDNVIEDPVQISEHLANYFESLYQIPQSSPSSDRIPDVDLTNDQGESLNKEFSVEELFWAMDKGGNTSVGLDNISYQMLRHLPFRIKMQVLEGINRIWCSGIIPTSWKEGIIVPLPKPGKDPKILGNQRPITLLSCFSKTVERMINRRLVNYIEQHARFNQHQFAFRNGRGVDTYLACLEKAIRLPFDEGRHCEILTIDLQKAYDKADRSKIISTLVSWGIKGKMINFIMNFLEGRHFRVAIGDCLSERKNQDTGIPQGSILSVTLFLVLMESVFEQVPEGLQTFVYADDVLILATDENAKLTRRKLQAAAISLGVWAKQTHMTISVEKSSFMHLCKKRKHPAVPSVLINSIEVPEVQHTRILGVTVDRRLNFKCHAASVRRSLQSILNILKIVGNRMNGGTRKSLLQITNAVLLPKLFFGITFANGGSSLNIKNLQPIYNSAVRESSGVFRTSPIDSIMVESGQLPFEHLMALHVTTKAVRMSGKISKLFPANENSTENSFPSINRAMTAFTNLTGKHIPKTATIQRICSRTWDTLCPNIDWCIKSQYKVGDTKAKAQQLFLVARETKYVAYKHIFTDGSVSNEHVGFGITCGDINISRKLPKECSIFSAEAMAILYAVTHLCSVSSSAVIFTDSASVLEALQNGQSQHPWVQEIEEKLGNKSVTLCWIPGHAGIAGNEKADALAKAETTEANDEMISEIPSEDIIRSCRTIIHNDWEHKWRNNTSFLRSIKSSTLKWPDRQNATERRALSRLRIGHTRLTHQHMFNQESNSCQTCGEALTVPHILLDCRAYEVQREQSGLETTIGVILGPEKKEEEKLVKFLKETNLLSLL